MCMVDDADGWTVFHDSELVPVETVEKLSRRAVADYRERLARAVAA